MLKKRQVNAILVDQVKRRNSLAKYIILILLAVSISITCSIIYMNNNKVQYINYNETSDIEYQVNLKDNKYFDTSYLQEDGQYITLPFNPRTTKTKRPQLHSERAIFSHISYLNQYRLYIKDAQGYQIEKYSINKYLVETIIGYLNLFDSKIAPVYADRTIVFKLLKSKASSIYDAIKNGSDDDDILFDSIAN